MPKFRKNEIVYVCSTYFSKEDFWPYLTYSVYKAKILELSYSDFNENEHQIAVLEIVADFWITTGKHYVQQLWNGKKPPRGQASSSDVGISYINERWFRRDKTDAINWFKKNFHKIIIKTFRELNIKPGPKVSVGLKMPK